MVVFILDILRETSIRKAIYVVQQRHRPTRPNHRDHGADSACHPEYTERQAHSHR